MCLLLTEQFRTDPGDLSPGVEFGSSVSEPKKPRNQANSLFKSLLVFGGFFVVVFLVFVWFFSFFLFGVVSLLLFC